MSQLSKIKQIYCCSTCGHTTGKWLGRCPNCNEWNSFIEKKESLLSKTDSFKISNPAKLFTLDKIESDESDRMLSGISEWDRTLGGGILPGSFLILTGDPGIGKSTLLLQIANKISTQYKVIYFSSEESLRQVQGRARRLKCNNTKLLFSDESTLENVIATALEEKPDLLILDSIQNCSIEKTQTIPGTPAQLRESGFHLMRLAKENKISILITGHITKDGHMAGPKLLEHMVDGVFYLQGEERWQTRILRSVKNRFGNINEIGFFEMEESGLVPVEDINKQLLEETSEAPGAALISYVEGSRPIILELQALSVPSKFGVPQRVVTGIDHKRVVLIAAILEKYLKVRLSSHDIFFKVSGGFKVTDSSIDLGIALALLSSYFQKPIKEKAVSMAEVSLTGQIKPTHQVNSCVKEVQKFGIKKIFIAKDQRIETSIKTTRFRNVFELLNLFPEDV
ncbi:DNA repair protein RadA [Candidatus Babeliales bacterium]|nr:DNA repair protein RadA [Candidatus Babeliales bacterium]